MGPESRLPQNGEWGWGVHPDPTLVCHPYFYFDFEKIKIIEKYEIIQTSHALNYVG